MISPFPDFSCNDCLHEWVETTDSQFTNELLTEVVCIKCEILGEMNNKTNEVFFPAT